MDAYNATTIDPIVPTSDAYIEEFILNSPLENGLHFDNKTGRISGTPVFSYKSKTSTVSVTARNALGNVSTTFVFYFHQSFSSIQGIRFCQISLSVPLPFLPDLFESSLDRRCSVLSSLSWANAADSKNELLGDAPYAMLQFSGYFNVQYRAPVSFSLSTNSKTLVLLDDFKTPLFETDPTSSFITHRVTIKLTNTFHRITVYVAAGAGSSYFSMFYSYHILNQLETLITSKVMSYHMLPPRFLAVDTIVGFAHQPFDVHLHSESLFSEIQLADSSKIFTIAGLNHLAIRDPIAGSSEVKLFLYSNGGLSQMSIPYRIEGPAEGMIVSVIENGVRQQKVVESISEFTLEFGFDRF